MSDTATDPLNDWFCKIGTGLSDKDYEAGIQAIARHDAEVAAKTLEDAADHVSGIDGRRDDAARDWLRVRAAEIREGA